MTDGWISTSDRLPEEGQRVIFAIGPGRHAYQYQVADYTGNVFEYTGGVINPGAVDYWMPVPAFPARHNDDDVEIWGNVEWEWLKALGFTGKLGNTCGYVLRKETPSGTVVVTWNDHSLVKRPLVEWPVPLEKPLKTRGEFRAALATL